MMDDPQKDKAPQLVDKARAAAKAENWRTCAGLCREGIALGDDVPLDSWLALRLGLASAAINLAPRESELVEEAIAETKRVVVRSDLPLNDERRGAAFRYLGGLYEARSVGTPQSNLTSVFEYYDKALGVFRKESFPEDWALLKVCIAVALRDRVRALGASFVRSSERERTETEESLRLAIQSCTDALEIYTASTHREENQEAKDLIASIELMIEHLNED